jgi:hypothetical protein
MNNKCKTDKELWETKEDMPSSSIKHTVINDKSVYG